MHLRHQCESDGLGDQRECDGETAENIGFCFGEILDVHVYSKIYPAHEQGRDNATEKAKRTPDYRVGVQ